MKKKQVALLLAALMCITPYESAAAGGTESFFGEETEEMQARRRSRSRGYGRNLTSGEEVSDFGTDEAPVWTDLHQKNVEGHRQTQQVLNR